MSKQWQDFSTVVFLIVAYFVTLYWLARLVSNGAVAGGARVGAAIGIAAYVATAILVFALGAAPEIWRTLAAPWE